jgi:hypothetical protein
VGAYAAVALLRLTPLHNNPAVLATAGILAGWLVVGLGIGLGGGRGRVEG